MMAKIQHEDISMSMKEDMYSEVGKSFSTRLTATG
jgi:hypothetical protein